MRTQPVLSVLLTFAALPLGASEYRGGLTRNGGFDESLAPWTVLSGSCALDAQVGASRPGSAVCASAATEGTNAVALHQCAPAGAGVYVFSADAQRLSGTNIDCRLVVGAHRTTDCSTLTDLATTAFTPDAARFVRSAAQGLRLDAATHAVSLDIACVSSAAFVVSVDDVAGLPDQIFKHGFEFVPPVIAAGAVLNYTENQAASVIDATLTVNDIDSTTLVGATAQISANYQSGADTLAFTPAGAITGSFSSGTGTLTLSGTDTLANYQAALRSVTFVNNSDDPNTLTRTVTWIANDGTALPSSAVISSVNVIAVNDAPVLAGTANLNYTENDAATTLSPALTVTDADSTNLTGATVRISANFDSGKDVLSFTPVGGITGSFVSDTLTLSGTSSLANYQTALRSVKYSNNSDNPSASTRSVTWQVNDGAAANNLSTAVISTIAVTAVNDAPTAVVPVGSPFAITGNVRRGLSIGTLLAGASDPEGSTLTAQLSGVPTNGATVAVNADGSFTYNPVAGYDGPASFQFVVCDAAPLCSTPVTVNVTISGMIWFINASAGAGTGRLTDPMNSITAFNAINNGTGNNPAANDNIYVYNGTYTGTLTLLSGQKLLGEGMSVSLATASGITPPAGSDALPTTTLANRPAWTSTGTTLTLGSGNTLRGFNIGNSSTAKISGTNFGTLTVNEIALSGSGKALALSTGGFSPSSGFDSITTTSSGTQGLSLAGVTGGTLSIGGTTISGATTQGILVGTSTANVSFGNTSVAAGTDGVSLQNNSGGTRSFGTLSITNGSGAGFLHAVGGGLTTAGNTTITNPGAECIFIQNATAANGVTFGNVNCTQSGATGVRLLTNAAPIAFADLDIAPDANVAAFLGTDNTATLTTTSGTLTAGNANAVQISGASTSSRTPLAMVFDSVTSSGGTNNVALSNVSGSLAMSAGALSAATAASFSMTGSTASVNYAGAITNSNNGIVLTNNTGGTIAFTGGMALSTGANAAFTATGGGTVSATQNNTSIVNTLSTTTGTALNVANTTIGAGGLTFRSISVNGGSNGIVLNNTGTGAGLTVTGLDGGDPDAFPDAGSGGTIQNTSTRGASFTSAVAINLTAMNFTNAATADFPAAPTGLSLGNNTADNASIHLQYVTGVVLDRLNMSGSQEQGINGHFVSGFTLSNSALSSLGNGPDEDGLHFFNMLGTCQITATTINGSGDDNINIQNNTNLAFPSGMTAATTLTITGGSANAGVLGSGYLMGIRGTSNDTVTLTGVTADNNFSGGIVIDTYDTATSVIDIGTSTSINNNDGIALSSNNGNTRFDIHNNVSFTGNDFARIGILKAALSTTGTLQGFIRNNSSIVVADGQAADAIIVNQAGAGSLNIAIQNNAIDYQGTQRPILVQAGSDGAGTANATITGNTIAVRLDGTGNAVTGILAQAAVASPTGDNSTLCADIGGAGVLKNVFTHPLGNNMAAGDIRTRQRFVSTVRLPGYGGANNDNAAVVTYMAGRNTLVNAPTGTATNDVGVVVGANGYTGGAACTQPVFP